MEDKGSGWKVYGEVIHLLWLDVGQQLFWMM